MSAVATMDHGQEERTVMLALDPDEVHTLLRALRLDEAWADASESNAAESALGPSGADRRRRESKALRERLSELSLQAGKEDYQRLAGRALQSLEDARVRAESRSWKRHLALERYVKGLQP